MDIGTIISSLSLPISIVGVVVICWGVLLVTIDFLHVEFFYLFQKKTKINKDQLRVKLGRYVLLGLEFLIAGDIMLTVVRPSRDALIVLATIVSIRTVISYFLRKELEASKKR